MEAIGDDAVVAQSAWQAVKAVASGTVGVESGIEGTDLDGGRQKT